VSLPNAIKIYRSLQLRRIGLSGANAFGDDAPFANGEGNRPDQEDEREAVRVDDRKQRAEAE
jgi:hypothetical protein